MKCLECPKNANCAWDECNLRYTNGNCPSDFCDLLDTSHLKDLPSYCHLNYEVPKNCPVIFGKVGA